MPNALYLHFSLKCFELFRTEFCHLFSICSCISIKCNYLPLKDTSHFALCTLDCLHFSFQTIFILFSLIWIYFLIIFHPRFYYLKYRSILNLCIPLHHLDYQCYYCMQLVSKEFYTLKFLAAKWENLMKYPITLENLALRCFLFLRLSCISGLIFIYS